MLIRRLSLSRLTRRGLTLLVLMMLAGCAAFSQHRVGFVATPLQPAPETTLIDVDLRTYEGTPEHASPLGTLHDAAQGVALEALHESGLFREVSFNDEARARANVVVRLSIYRQTSTVWPYVTAILNYFSATLIPVYANEQYTITLEQLDATGRVSQRLVDADAVHHYGGLLFLPAAMLGKTPAKAVNETLNNQIEHLVAQAEQMGWFAAK